MRFLIPVAVAASLFAPAAALACPNCIMHGTEREDKAWSTIMGRQNPLMPATASAPATAAKQAKPAKAANQPKAATPTKASK
jgi:hypothetical protein